MKLHKKDPSRFLAGRELTNHFCRLNLPCNQRWYLEWTSTDTLAAWCEKSKLVSMVLTFHALVTGTRSLSKPSLSVICGKHVKQMKTEIERMNCQETKSLPRISGLTVPLCGTAPWLKACHPRRFKRRQIWALSQATCKSCSWDRHVARFNDSNGLPQYSAVGPGKKVSCEVGFGEVRTNSKAERGSCSWLQLNARPCTFIQQQHSVTGRQHIMQSVRSRIPIHR